MKGNLELDYREYLLTWIVNEGYGEFERYDNSAASAVGAKAIAVYREMRKNKPDNPGPMTIAEFIESMKALGFTYDA